MAQGVSRSYPDVMDVPCSWVSVVYDPFRVNFFYFEITLDSQRSCTIVESGLTVFTQISFMYIRSNHRTVVKTGKLVLLQYYKMELHTVFRNDL